MRIGKNTVVEDLQENIEYLGVSLFDFIEEHYGIRFSSYFFGELSALVEAYVTGRRAYEFGYADFIHILGHIHSYHKAFVTEHCLGKRFG